MMLRTILNPLKIKSSGLCTDSKDIDNLAVGHDEDGTSRAWGWSCEAALGLWAMRSTARGMVSFLAAIMEASQEKEDASVVLQAMATSHKAYRSTDTEGCQIGLGWRIKESTGTRMKSGSGDVQESNMYLIQFLY